MTTKKKKKKKGLRLKKEPKDAFKATMKQYAKAKDDLAEFEADNQDVLLMHVEMKNAVAAYEQQLKELAIAKLTGKDRKKVIEDEATGYKAVVSVSRNRIVDAKKLMKLAPKVRDWPGIFSVKLSEYDAAVSADVIPEAAQKAVLSYGNPRFTFNIRTAEG